MKKIIKRHKPYYWFLLITWLLLCCYALLSYLLHSEVWSNSEVSVLFHLKMLVLTFPLGYVAAFIVGALSKLLSAIGLESTGILAQQISLFATWLAMIVIGYFQWFVWLPKLFLLAKSLIWKKN